MLSPTAICQARRNYRFSIIQHAPSLWTNPRFFKLSKVLQISPNFSKFLQVLEFNGKLCKTARIDIRAFMWMYMFSPASCPFASPSVVSSLAASGVPWFDHGTGNNNDENYPFKLAWEQTRWKVQPSSIIWVSTCKKHTMLVNKMMTIHFDKLFEGLPDSTKISSYYQANQEFIRESDKLIEFKVDKKSRGIPGNVILNLSSSNWWHLKRKTKLLIPEKVLLCETSFALS